MRGHRIAALALAAVLGLSGCGWLDGSYVSVTPHQVGLSRDPDGEATQISSYTQLRSALVALIDSGSTEGLFSLADYPREAVLEDMERAVAYAAGQYPIGAYAVESIDYDFGTGLGASAMSVDISYRCSREDIGRIRTVRWISGAQTAIADAMDDFEESLVLQVTGYQETDFSAIVREYAWRYPDRVMEQPEVSVHVYPDRGETRVVELTFHYETDRTQLRAMREQVQPVFSSAALYVSGQAEDRIKFNQLHTFLTERFEYTITPSVTPAYSLLCRGTGDSRAFSQVYTAMCSRIGLEAMSICGTSGGEERWWNLVKIDGEWYHLDLLGQNWFEPMTAEQMTGYEWDSSAVPPSPEPGE